jgi:ABC-2 type transport system ATP-binding protein
VVLAVGRGQHRDTELQNRHAERNRNVPAADQRRSVAAQPARSDVRVHTLTITPGLPIGIACEDCSSVLRPKYLGDVLWSRRISAKAFPWATTKPPVGMTMAVMNAITANSPPGPPRLALEACDQPQPVIEVSGLTKRFGQVLAVDDLSFQVSRGTVAGFLGPNGAGKTTTLRMLLGLVRPTGGTATVNGVAYSQLENPLREVGAVLEAASFHPGRTARGHLRVQALAADVEATRIDELLDLVELTAAADRRVGGFSLGMRQRLGLAVALLADPQILILDEPANGLDPEGVRWLRDLIRGLANQGRTVLVSSHILAEVAQTVDSVVILNLGRLVTHGTLEQLTARTHHAVRVRTANPRALLEALDSAGIQACITEPDRVEATNATSEEVGTLAARHRIPIFEITTNHLNLEDVFLELTGSKVTEEDSR